MPTPALKDELLEAFVRTYKKHEHTVTVTAKAMGLSLSQGKHYKRIAKARGIFDRIMAERAVVSEIEVKPGPETNEPIEDLVKRKKERVARALEHDEWAKLIPVSIKADGPIAVCLVGDPHIDDAFCDIQRLESDLSTVNRTKGFFAGHVGDLTNNWVGRLAAQYAHQNETFDEAIRLTEWMLGLCPNLFVVGGNHDMWNNGMDLVRFITRQSGTTTQAHGVRMELKWPTGKAIRLHCRHDFPGDSIYNPTHGHRRETLWGHRDHILIAGHKHIDAASVVPSIDGECHWMFRVSGYKIIDDYAKERNFRPMRMAPAVSVILDPHATHKAEFIKPFWDTEEAADYLTFKRRKAGL